MKRRRGPKGDEAKVEIQMTPMLDMIFQLLVFFILTFRPVSDEGQFEVNMSALQGGSVATPGTTSGPAEDPGIQIRIQLKADADGRLSPSGVIMGEHRLNSMSELQAELRRTVGEMTEEFELVIQADSNLHYEYVVQAINEISHAGLKKVSFATPTS